jgi:hypothetical protein
MKYTSVTQPKYANAEGNKINCWVAFDGFENPLPFTASPNDSEFHGRQIYAELVAGKYGIIAAFNGGIK